MERRLDNSEWWRVRLGEIEICDYIVIFGYVHSWPDQMYVRVYRKDNLQIIGDLLKQIRAGYSCECDELLVNKIHEAGKKFEKLRAFT